MEKDLVYLVWTDVNTGNKYKVAELYKQDNTFYFKYMLKKLKRLGLNYLLPSLKLMLYMIIQDYLLILQQDCQSLTDLKLRKS